MNTGSLIPNQSPGAFRCGTFYPIWLNGICLALINQINEINVLLGIKILTIDAFTIAQNTNIVVFCFFGCFT